MADFNDKKIALTDFAGQDISGITEDTVTGRADWLKERFDSAAKEVITPKFNAALDALSSPGEQETPSGAARIGAKELLPGGAKTVEGQLSYLMNEIAGTAVSTLPDGSVTDAKLSNDPAALKARVASLETGAGKAPLDSPALTGTPTAPTPAAGDSSTRLATTAFVASGLSSAAAHISNADLHVSATLKARGNNLPVANGGTGATTAEGAFANLVGTTVSVEKGGTGASSRTAAFANLVSGSVVGLANGGTGAATAPAAREALGFSYGSAAPSGIPAGGAGSVYFKV